MEESNDQYLIIPVHSLNYWLPVEDIRTIVAKTEVFRSIFRDKITLPVQRSLQLQMTPLFPWILETHLWYFRTNFVLLVMVVFSRFDGKCEETLHPWTVSCSFAALELFYNIFKASFRIYGSVYLVRLKTEIPAFEHLTKIPGKCGGNF